MFEGEMFSIKAFIGILYLSICFSMGGCSRSDQNVLEDEVNALREQISRSSQTNDRLYGQINALHEDMILLEDRVESQRISLERQGTMTMRTREELPVYEVPQVDPVYSILEQLPIERVIASPSETTEDILITNETLSVFVTQFGGNPHEEDSGTGSEDVFGPEASAFITLNEVEAVETEQVAVVSRVDVSTERTSHDTSSLIGQELYQSSLRMFNAGNYPSALAGFQRFFDGGPSADYRDNALYWIGECYYAIEAFWPALVSFQRVVDEYPDGNKVPDSLLKIGLTYERMNNRDSASEVLSVLVETYPLTEAARRASQRLTEFN
jgi:tol-pal system protein YbgF